jgi:hypothetical protein
MAKFRHLDQLKLKVAKEEFSKILTARVIPRSSNCWANLHHMVCHKRRFMVAMWRFQEAEPGHDRGQVSTAQYGGPVMLFRQLHSFKTGCMRLPFGHLNAGHDGPVILCFLVFPSN